MGVILKRYQLYIMCFYPIADFFSIGIDLFSIADFHADFCYLFQIAERTWTPLSTEGDKNKSRKRLHLRCRIGTFLFCFPCIETSTAASSSPARGPAVLTALPSSLTSIVLIQRCSQALLHYFYPNLRSTRSRASAASTSVGSHSTAATNRRSRAPI